MIYFAWFLWPENTRAASLPLNLSSQLYQPCPAWESASIHESPPKTSHKAPAQISPNIQQLQSHPMPSSFPPNLRNDTNEDHWGGPEQHLRNVQLQNAAQDAGGEIRACH